MNAMNVEVVKKMKRRRTENEYKELFKYQRACMQACI